MSRAFLTTMLLVTIALPAWAQRPDVEDASVTVLFSTDLRGRLIDAGCGTSEEAPAPLLPRFAAAMAAERAAALRDGRPGPVLVDAGDALFPSPMDQDLMRDEQSVAALVESLRSAGYDAMATGNTTLSAANDALLALLRTARAAGLPMLASNFQCQEEGSDACRDSAASQVERSVIIERDGLRIGVFSLLPEDQADRIARQNVEGATFGDPVEVAREVVRGLRDGGADLVVLLSHVDRSATAPRGTLQVMARLRGDEAPDLVIAASTAGLAVRIRTAGEGPPVLAVGGSDLGRAVLRREAGRWAVVEAGTIDLPTPGDEVLGRVLSGWRTAYCAQQARPLVGAALSGDMDQEDFLHLVLRVMRSQTRADIAMINSGIVTNRRLFPLQGQLTMGHLRRILPFDNEVRVATIRGSQLSKIAQRIVDAEGAQLIGLEKQGSKIRINGRDLEPDTRYRLVTIDFVADGGDGILGTEALDLEFEVAEPDPDGGVMLVERLATWFRFRDEPYDPDERQNLYTRPLWYGAFTVNLSLANTSVTDGTYGGDDAYDQPQLQRENLFDLRLGGEFRGGVSTRDHRWDNHLTLRYGRQRQEDDVGSDSYDWTESADLVMFRSAYVLDYIRNQLLDGAWYGPSLFVEYQLESEFDNQDDSAHFLEMTGTAGLQLKPLSWLVLLVGAGVRSRVLSDDPDPVAALAIRGEITRRQFFGLQNAPIYISALVDYSLTWPSAGPTHKLSAEGRLEVQLYGPLLLTASLRLFVYDEEGLPTATAVDSTLGLTIAMMSRAQSF